MTVEWEVFAWAIGIIISFFTMIIGYLSKKINELSQDCILDRKDTEDRLNKVEDCHSKTEVKLAEINKDIQYIKLKQDEMSLNIEKLLTKPWCAPRKRK